MESWGWGLVGGRRHYNLIRRLRADVRRLESVDMWVKLVCADVPGPGAKVARAFGVSRSTICRDVPWFHLLGEINYTEHELKIPVTIRKMRRLWRLSWGIID